jgi:C-terminal processing protease CtpA/Prc
MHRRTCLAAITGLAYLPSVPVIAAPKGTIGFSVEVEGDGSFFKPVIKSAKVSAVRSGSPAEAAGLKVGDEILKVQGVPIENANARHIAELIEVAPGEELRLDVRRSSGAERTLAIIAGKPE